MTAAHGELTLRLVPAEFLAPGAAPPPEFAPGLYAVVTFEVPHGVEVDEDYLTRSIDDSQGTPLEQAERNLAALPVERHEIVHVADGGAFHLLSGESGSIASQVLVFDQLYRKLTGKEVPDGGLVCAIPTDRHLLFFPQEEGSYGTLTGVAERAAELFVEGPRELSPHVYLWRAGEMTQLTVQQGDEIRFRPSADVAADATEGPLADDPSVPPDPHNFVFVTRVLGSAALDYGALLLSGMREGKQDPNEYLAKGWADIGAYLPAEQRRPLDLPHGRLTELRGHEVLLVTFAGRIEPAESYFAAIVRPAGSPVCRFFTLANDGRSTSRTALLGEWQASGYVPLQEDVLVDEDAFLQGIADVVAPPKRRGLFRRRR
ncbi:hypothetical protein [Amycolatopsis orientalis]|uniref:hypothetical protein n=1 Tax=Amycolatopsis orientalis TaxID=31958 RepID=UPI0003A15735|nr:hypothetical protein [Amycolatopsis orientalis]